MTVVTRPRLEGWDVGDPVRGAACPSCGHETVVYNGNYWCEREACEWAMDGDDPDSSPVDRAIIKRYLLQCWAAAKAKGDESTMERMATHLLEYAGKDGWL